MKMTKKRLLIRTHYNRNEFPPIGEKNGSPSCAIPDQTLTLRQIIDRYAKGLTVPESAHAVYDDEDGVILPDFRRMDLVDQADWAEKTKRELKDKVENINASRKKQADEAEFSKRLEAYKQSLGSNQSQTGFTEPPPTR